VHIGNAELTTTARARACEDVRNSLSFAVMNACCVPLSTPELIINVNATQFTCGDKATQPTTVVYTGKRPKQLKTEPTGGSQGLTNYFIKYYATINAAGDQARSIYILADDNMLPGEIDVKEVAGIGAGASSKEISYLVYSKTRCPTVEFYKWYIRIVLIPWVQELREYYRISTDVPAYFQLDGDAAQIAPFLHDTQIRELMDEHNVLVGKPSGSTSEIS
jgi:hypothetical protein